MQSDLVGIFEFEAGDDLTLQLVVLARLAQDRLAELRDVGPTSFSQHRVQPVVWRRKRRRREVSADSEQDVNDVQTFN